MERYRKILEEASNTELEALNIWYSLFKTGEDPFTQTISIDNSTYFVNQEKIIEEIIFNIGISKRNIPINIFLVSPVKGGKTSIFHYINAVIRKLIFTKEIDLQINIEYVDINEDPDDPNSTHLIELTNKRDVDAVFFDNLERPSQIKAYSMNLPKIRFKAFAISPFMLDESLEIMENIPKTYFIKKLNYEEIYNVLDKRLNLHKQNDSNYELKNLFLKEALIAIHKYSFGVPYLALRLASESFKIQYEKKLEFNKQNEKRKITKDVVLLAAKRCGSYFALHNLEKLSNTKKGILTEIMSIGKTNPTQLSKILKKDRTTISRHVSEFNNLNLISYKIVGREAIFSLREAVKIKMSIDMMKEWG